MRAPRTLARTWTRKRTARLAAVGALWCTSGCVVVPVTRDVYDPNCRLMRREVTLEAAVLGQFHSCNGQDCAALLAALGIVSAATLVVSGSMAVVGNAVYWLEHEANCRRRAAPDAPVAPIPPGPSPAPTGAPPISLGVLPSPA